MAFTHHGGATGTFTHAHHWELPVALLASNGKFLSANAAEAGHAFGDREKILGTVVTADAPTIGPQQRWLLEWVPEHNQVAFRAHHSNFLSAGADGNVHANQAARTETERWVLSDVGEPGYVGLKSSTGQFLHADPATGAVTASASAGGGDAKFRVFLNPVAGDTTAAITELEEQTLGVAKDAPHPIIPVAILADHKDFVAATPEGIHAEKRAESDADVFFVDVQGSDKVTLRTPHNKYVNVTPTGDLSLSDAITDDSHWFLVQLSDGRTGFHSVHKRFIAAEPSGRVVADRSTPGGWEAFRLFPGVRAGVTPDHIKPESCINLVIVTDHHISPDA